MTHKIFIDGGVGTTGLEIVERLAGRPELSFITLDEDKRKDAAARREALNAANIVILCLPWTDVANLKSPYVSLFSLAGYPWAATAMKVVLFVSFMSVMNSFLFSNSRMLYSLSQRGYAPELFGRTNARGVPLNALALSFAVCLAILAVHFASAGDLFLSCA